MAQASKPASVTNIVLVHGAFVDGSGWEGVYDALRTDGYTVAVVQNPTRSLAEDVAFTQRVIHAQDGPVVLVGHSYGGAVITEAGNDAQVAGLVYLAGFVPDQGESVAELIRDVPPGTPTPPIVGPHDGYLLVDRTKFRASFAADVAAAKAAFMADAQVPWGIDAMRAKVGEAAWKTRPSWYLVTTDDRMIPADTQRAMAKRARSTVVEVASSHSVFVSQPAAVARLIANATVGAHAIAAE